MVYLTTLSVSRVYSETWLKSLRGFEINGLIEVLSRYLPEGTEES
jgi:hypothetical protein